MRLDNRVSEEALGNELRPPGPVSLNIDEQRQGPDIVLVLRGELDILTAPRFTSFVQAILLRGEGDVTLDLCALAFIDSSGLHVLLNAQRRLIRRGRHLHVRCIPGPVMRSIALARLSETLGVILARPEPGPEVQLG